MCTEEYYLYCTEVYYDECDNNNNQPFIDLDNPRFTLFSIFFILALTFGFFAVVFFFYAWIWTASSKSPEEIPTFANFKKIWIG